MDGKVNPLVIGVCNQGKQTRITLWKIEVEEVQFGVEESKSVEEAHMAMDWLAEGESVTELSGHPRLPVAIAVISDQQSKKDSLVMVQVVSKHSYHLLLMDFKGIPFACPIRKSATSKEKKYFCTAPHNTVSPQIVVTSDFWQISPEFWEIGKEFGQLLP